MKRRIAVSMRVDNDGVTGEQRDGLDQKWFPFLIACGLVPCLVPNCRETAERLIALFHPEGILLTGGGDLVSYGGETPERDSVEALLFAHARDQGIPLLGVCRGFQYIANQFGGRLAPVSGHVGLSHAVVRHGSQTMVNSYHRLGIYTPPAPFVAFSVAIDGVIEGMYHPEEAMTGIMWHPERTAPFDPADIALFRSTFGVDKCEG